MPRTCLAPFALAALLSAQQAPPTPAKPAAPTAAKPALTAASFLPPDYKMTAWADLKGLRDREIWDDLKRSALGALLPSLEREAGFPLDALDRVQIVATSRNARDGAMAAPPEQVLVCEGNSPLGMPEWATRGRNYQPVQVGAFEGYARGTEERGEIALLVEPKLYVYGGRPLVEPVLLGKPSNGKPSADLQSLLSGRGDNLLYMVIATEDPMAQKTTLARMFPGTEWPENDPVTFVMARMRAIGKGDDLHLEVEAVLRHRLGKEGLDTSETAVREWLVAMQTHPRLGAMKALWKSIEPRREGPDLVLRKDLGRPREAVGTLATLLLPLLQH